MKYSTGKYKMIFYTDTPQEIEALHEIRFLTEYYFHKDFTIPSRFTYMRLFYGASAKFGVLILDNLSSTWLYEYDEYLYPNYQRIDINDFANGLKKEIEIKMEKYKGALSIQTLQDITGQELSLVDSEGGELSLCDND